MPSEVTWVMISNFLLVILVDLKLSLTNKLMDILGNMNYFKVCFEFRIFIFESVIAVGGRDKNFPDPIVDKCFDIFPGQAFKNILISCLADAFPTTIFLNTEYAEFNPRLVEIIDRSPGNFFLSLVIADLAAGEK